MQFQTYEKCIDSKVDWLGQVPQDWTLCRVKDCLYIKNGKEYVESNSDDKYPVYGSGGIFAYTDNYLHKGESILMGRKGTIDKPLHVNDIFWTVDTMFYSSVDKDVLGEYVYYYSLLFPYKKIYTQTALPSMTQRSLDALQLFIPKREVQVKLVNFIKQKTTLIDKKIELLKEKKTKYIELKQSLINDAVTKGLDKNVDMKESGIEWVGKIPKHWETKRLKNIFNERVEKNLQPNGEPVTNNILSVMKDVGVINHRDKGLVGNKMSEDITRYKLVHVDDIVVNKMNVLIGSVGISREFGALSVIYIILKTKSSGVAEYYDYLFKIKRFQKSLRGISTGILEIREAVNMILFMGQNFPIPPKKEQVQIVNFLNEKTEKINVIVKTIDKQIELLEEFRKTLINDVVTGKIKVT